MSDGAMGVRDHIDDDAGDDDEEDDEEEQEEDGDNDDDDEEEVSEASSASAQGLGPGLSGKGSEKVEGKSSGAFSMEQSVAFVREKARQRSGVGGLSSSGSSGSLATGTTSATDLTALVSVSSSSSAKSGGGGGGGGGGGDLPADPTALRKQQQAILDSRRLINDLQAKRVNKKYLALIKTRETLPAYQMRKELVEAIGSHRVVVISGDTGESTTHRLTYSLTH